MRLINIYYLLLFLVLLSSLVSSNNLFMAYNLELIINDDDIKINNITKNLAWNSSSYKLQETYYDLNSDLESSDFKYSYALFNKDEFIVKGAFFIPQGVYLNVPERCFNESYAGDDCSSYFMPEQFVFYLSIPYNARASSLILYDPSGSEILHEDVSYFSDYCGDGVCSVRESFLSCPIDCEDDSLLFKDKFIASNFELSSSSEFKVFFKESYCLAEEINCIENLGLKSNIFVNAPSDIFIDDKNENYNILFNEEANILISNHGEIHINKEEFKISFNDFKNLGVIVKEYVAEEGRICEDVFNPSSNLNLLSRSC